MIVLSSVLSLSACNNRCSVFVIYALKKEEEFETEYKELKKQYQLPTLKA